MELQHRTKFKYTVILYGVGGPFSFWGLIKLKNGFSMGCEHFCAV